MAPADGKPFTIPPDPAAGVVEGLGVADCILRNVGTGVVGPRVEGAVIGVCVTCEVAELLRGT